MKNENRKTIQSITRYRTPYHVSPSEYNAELEGSTWINPDYFYNVIQNVSNFGGTILELDNDLSIVNRIIPSERTIRLLLNDRWVSRGDVFDYMDEKTEEGNLFFVKFD